MRACTSKAAPGPPDLVISGQPHVVQYSSSTTMGPGGVRETKKTFKDSRSGDQRMQVRHIAAHITTHRDLTRGPRLRQVPCERGSKGGSWTLHGDGGLVPGPSDISETHEA